MEVVDWYLIQTFFGLWWLSSQNAILSLFEMLLEHDEPQWLFNAVRTDQKIFANSGYAYDQEKPKSNATFLRRFFWRDLAYWFLWDPWQTDGENCLGGLYFEDANPHLGRISKLG